jgi:NAD(P)-dependent dehydrogenase (short-subunit alcohol dehydrogenase family)
MLDIQSDTDIFSSHFLKGKVALVTGASRGIGKAIALGLASAGAKVALLSRTETQNQKLQKTIELLGTECISATVDVKDTQSLELFINECRQNLGNIDILVNNAGIYYHQAVKDHLLQDWHEVLETNLTSALITCRCVVSDMIEQGWGRIINISSISGKIAEINGSAYSASKFGLIGLTQSLALETAKHGITVNAICPGWVKTDITSWQLSHNPDIIVNGQPDCSLDGIELARLSIPQERFIEPSEVAALVLFLCTHSARGITGQALNICGGLSLH